MNKNLFFPLFYLICFFSIIVLAEEESFWDVAWKGAKIAGKNIKETAVSTGQFISQKYSEITSSTKNEEFKVFEINLNFIDCQRKFYFEDF